MSLAIELHPPGSDVAGAITGEQWLADTFDFWAFDRRVDELFARTEPLHVVAVSEQAAAVREQIAIRTQRLSTHRNAHTSTPWFARVLVEHRALHDVTKPLVRADLDHALDTWQWTLRLDREAPAAVQLAALLHDVERLVSEADTRIEHLAPDYQAFKDAHARGSASLARALCERALVPERIAADACELIAIHERAGGEPHVRAINDADALSFFSLNSPGYLAYYGAAQTEKKVAYTYARMSPAARGWLERLRVPEFVRTQLRSLSCAS